MTVYRLFAAVLVGILTLSGAVTLIAHCFIPAVTQVIDPSELHANGDNSFQVVSTLESKWLRFLEIRSDQIGRPSQSNLVILEDGKPLAPPHSIHAEIKEKGNGRYSHWVTPTGSVVIFSTSDNSDPRTNGRKYELAARPVPYPSFTAITLLLPLLLFALQQLLLPKLDSTVGVITTLCLAALVTWLSFLRDQVIIAPDSSTYIEWSHLVPLGYPLFLSGAKATFGTLRYVGAVQVSLLVFACIFLASSMRRLVQTRAIQIATLLLLLHCIPMFWGAGWLLSEALFIPLILLNLAAALHLITQQEVRYALILAITAALILFVRPAGYFIPMGLIFLLVAQRGRARWMLKWACLPFAICTIATLLINVAIRGNNVPSQMGRVLFPTVAFLFEPQFVSGPHKEFAPVIEQVLRSRLDSYNNAADNTARVAYSISDYNSRLNAMDIAINEKCAARRRQCSFEYKEGIYLTFFLSTVINRPLGYLNLVLAQTVDAWTTKVLAAYGPFRDTYLDAARELPTRLEYVRTWKLPLADDEVRLSPHLIDSFPGRFVEVFDLGYQFIQEQRWLIYLTGIVSLIAIPIAALFRRASVYWLALGYCGVVIHGSILLTAAVTVFIHRYAVPVDPVILISGAIMISGLIQWSASHIERFAATIIDVSFLRRSHRTSTSARVEL